MMSVSQPRTVRLQPGGCHVVDLGSSTATLERQGDRADGGDILGVGAGRLRYEHAPAETAGLPDRLEAD
jgi:hypothetical protein